MFSRTSSFRSSASCLGAAVELLVVGVDLARRGRRHRATRTRGSAARGASARARRPAPSGSAGPGASRTPGRRGARLGRSGLCVWSGSRRPCLTIEHARRDTQSALFRQISQKTPFPGSCAHGNCVIRRAGDRYHGSMMPQHRTSRDRRRPDHRPDRLRAETTAGARPLARQGHPRVPRLAQRRPRRRGRRDPSPQEHRAAARRRAGEPVAHKRR